MPPRARNREAGQAAVAVILAAAVFLIGAVGLAIDGSHLYAEQQMAQAAADAAAQATMRSIFAGSNSFSLSSGSSFTCGSSDSRTPCYYAQTLNGFNGAGDTITVDVPSAATVGVPAGTLSSDPVNLLRVTIARQVPTTLFKFIGSWTPTVHASATGAIVDTVSPMPIVITHPTLAGALSVSGNITINGGPRQSIQVNSSDSAAFSGAGAVNLTAAGPAGTGANFSVFGGPTANPGSVNPGTGLYIAPSPPILDPLASISPPGVPPAAPPPASCTITGHCGNCPSGVPTCTEYQPGLYAGATVINLSGPAIFDPGIYYIQGTGFKTNGYSVAMCSSCAANPTTANGMLVYDTGLSSGGCDATGGFSIAGTGGGQAVFWGAGVSASNPTATPSAPYYGILFFEDRSACAQTHNLVAGSGCLSVYGTIYITNTLSIMQTNPSEYQSVVYNATPCSGTVNFGGIVASQLTIGANGLNMGLYPTGMVNIRQLALVQ